MVNTESYESRYRSIRSVIDRALPQTCPTRLREGRLEFCVLTGDIDESEAHATSLHDVNIFAPATTKIGNLIPAPDHVFAGCPEALSGIENYTDFYMRSRGAVVLASSAVGKEGGANSACHAPWSSRCQKLVWAGIPTHDWRVKYIEALKQHGQFANVTIGLGQMQFIDQGAFEHVLDV